jgi:hypothetical protein
VQGGKSFQRKGKAFDGAGAPAKHPENRSFVPTLKLPHKRLQYFFLKV